MWRLCIFDEKFGTPNHQILTKNLADMGLWNGMSDQCVKTWQRPVWIGAQQGKFLRLITQLVFDCLKIGAKLLRICCRERIDGKHKTITSIIDC